jgi:hypothetical protein
LKNKQTEKNVSRYHQALALRATRTLELQLWKVNSEKYTIIVSIRRDECDLMCGERAFHHTDKRKQKRKNHDKGATGK